MPDTEGMWFSGRIRIAISVVAVAAACAGLVLSRRSTTPTNPAQIGAHVERDVRYADASPRNRLDVYWPPEAAPALGYPVVVYFHGGGWVDGDKSAPLPVATWTERGYAVVAVNYRFAKGEHRIADSIDDAEAAVRFVIDEADRWQLDPDRVGVYGHSAGGHLAAMVAQRRVPIAAVALSGAPTDLVALIDPTVPFFDGHRGAGSARRVAGLLGCASTLDSPWDDAGCQAVALAASPAQLPAGTSPMLIVHGDADPVVGVDQARRLHDRLAADGTPVETVIVPAGGHQPFTDPEVADFLDRLLGLSSRGSDDG